MIPACILFIASILFTTNVDARMYQWTDEDTGTTQLSGKPPTWYRSDQGGPRVFVFEKNRIIDDTAIEVSDGERESLRQEAFLKAEEDRAAAREKAMAAEELKSSLKKDRLLQEETAAMVGEEPEEIMPEEEAAAETEMVEMPADDQTLEEMRKLIHEWEEQQAREARQKLEMQQEANPVY